MGCTDLLSHSKFVPIPTGAPIGIIFAFAHCFLYFTFLQIEAPVSLVDDLNWLCSLVDHNFVEFQAPKSPILALSWHISLLKPDFIQVGDNDGRICALNWLLYISKRNLCDVEFFPAPSKVCLFSIGTLRLQQQSSDNSISTFMLFVESIKQYQDDIFCFLTKGTKCKNTCHTCSLKRVSLVTSSI